MDFKEYKEFHERHMANNTGGTVWETGMVLTSVPLGVFLSLWIATFLNKFTASVAEFLLSIIPVILGVTVMSDMVYMLPLHFLLIAAASVLNSGSSNIKKVLKENVGVMKGFITNYRASTNFVSVLCILAVDFNVFPKRFAKTENFGFSLMDLGVGFYICSNGIVVKHLQSTRNFPKLLKTVLVLVTLGIIRLLTTKSIEYHEHVAEYGTHWNFFFTLAMCKLIAYCVLASTNCSNAIYLTILTAAAHQISLYGGLQAWVLSDIPRDNFVTANREGISSSLGYVSLYFAAVSLGSLINTSATKRTKGTLLFYLSIVCLTLWVFTGICYVTIDVSRRLANLGYIFWIMALTVTVIIEFFLAEIGVDLLKKSKKIYKDKISYVPKLFDAINANGLFFFLLGNLLTGLINIMFQTLLLGTIHSIVLLTLYMLITCYISYFLCNANIKLKF